MTTDLLLPFKLNDSIELKNRILMAPLTRCMADDNLVPTQAMIDYYTRRADAGLIISEATIIRSDGQGNPNTPGLFTDEQIQGWKKVTDSVHSKGGKMFAQLWHVGRVAHPHFFGGGDVLAPSAIKVEGTVPRMRELSYVTPKAATKADIEQLVADYATAAENAIKAGFDGVEIHGANGYLIDQFLHYASNQRNDEYGETPEKMARFALDVVDAIVEKVGAERTGLRLSPGAYFNMEEDTRDKAVFDYLLNALQSRSLAYVHGGIFDDSMRFDSLHKHTVSEYLRASYKGVLVGVGNYSFEEAGAAINESKFDLIAIGRPFIANPDYIAKVTHNQPLTPYSAEMLDELV